MKKYLIKLDVYKGLLEAKVMQFDQLNTQTCTLEFELTSNGSPLSLVDERVTIAIKTPSGAVVEDHVQIIDVSGKCEATLANDMITEVGMHYGELCIYSNDNVQLFTTANFRYSVSKQIGEANVKVDTRYTTLQELLFEVTALKDKGVVDIARVEQLLTEATTISADVTTKHSEVSIDHADVVIKHSEVLQNAKRTEDNAQQVSTDKGVVTRYKNDVSTMATQVTSDAQQVSSNKTIAVDKANIAAQKATIATEQATIATQKAQQIVSSADQINRNKQDIVDTLPTGRKSGQLFFVRKRG